MSKKKRKIKLSRVLILLLPIIIIIVFLGYFINRLVINKVEDYILYEDCIFDKKTYIKFKDLNLESKYYLISRNNEVNQIVYAYGIHEKIYPASLTKLMSLYVVLNNVDDSELETMLRVTYDDLKGLIEANAAVYGLNINDTISIKNALYGLILNSGADMANILVRYIEDKGINFIDKMNEYASKLGMLESHFMNATGLYDDNNYSSLYDINILVSELFKNDLAKNILLSMRYEDDGYIFRSTLAKYQDYLINDNAKILGGKTGFTLESHLNIMAIMENKLGYSFIILANADEKGQYKNYAHLEDVRQILNHYYH